MRARALFAAALAGLLAGCSTSGFDSYNRTTEAVPPRASGPAPQIMAVLSCIRDSGALRNRRIAVAIHADGTGKYNHIGEGSTGNYLPQGTTAVYASEAVLAAGGQAFNYYELNTERAMRAFAGADEQQLLASKQDAVLPNYVLSTSFTALDFMGGPDVDLQVAGIGPSLTGRGASLEAVAELYQPGSRKILKTSSVQRYIAFVQAGMTVAKYFGSTSPTLVTGSVLYADQQRLQEGTRDAVALSVADVLSQFPRVPETCRGEVENLLSGKGWDDPVPSPVVVEPSPDAIRPT
jgi:hypothetical protein